MQVFIKRIPTPFCGVILSIASLGLLLEPYVAAFLPACGIIAGLLLFCYLVRCALFPREVINELENPVISGVAGTFPSIFIVLSVYLARIQWHLGFVFWLIGIAIFAVLIVRFTIKFAIKAKLADLTPAYFVIYIPILLAAITAPNFGTEAFGRVLFWVVFIVWIALFVLVSIRLFTKEPLPKPLLPLLCIYAAPMSMCLAAYISCFPNPNETFVTVIHISAFVLTIAGFMALLVCLRLPFTPSYAAMTFPFVISAQTTTLHAQMHRAIGEYSPFDETLAVVEIALASAIVLYVFIRYVLYFYQGIKGESA